MVAADNTSGTDAIIKGTINREHESAGNRKLLNKISPLSGGTYRPVNGQKKEKGGMHSALSRLVFAGIKCAYRKNAD